MKHIKGLDALRALAVLLVIRSHWGPNEFRTMPWLTFVVQKILPSGVFGVDFFFVLSGFLITEILLQARIRTPIGGRVRELRIFIVRRSLRIFPVYYVFLFLLLLINYPAIRENFTYFVSYTSNFLSFSQSSWNSFSHTWSLSVEEQFYILWPFIIIFFPFRWLPGVMFCFLILSTALAVLTQKIYGPFAFILTFNCFNAFALGGLYAFSTLFTAEGTFIKKMIYYALPFAVVLYVLRYFQLNVVPERIINAIISINLIIYISETKYGNFVRCIVENRILTAIGKVSYGVYLFHYVIPYLYQQLLDFLNARNLVGQKLHFLLYTPLLVEVLQFGFLIALSFASYYWFELKILKLKRFFQY